MASVKQCNLIRTFIASALLVAIFSSSPVSTARSKRDETNLPSIDDLIIPACMNVNLTTDQAGAVEPEFSLINDSNPSDYNGRIPICYPLSPTFHECRKKWLVQSAYIVLENHTLEDTAKGRMHPLGSYYINPDGFALTCHAGKTCNYLMLKPGEYKVMDTSLHLELLNKTLHNAKYTIDPTTQMANVCYPLSQNFISCPKWVLERNDFQIEANKMLYNKARAQYHDPGDYVTIGKKRAVECISITVEEELPFDVFIIHAVVHVISAICLAVTIVVHLIIPELSYQRAPLLCHAFSLMVMYTCLAARKFSSEIDIGTGGCCVLFYATYFFALASFCWLSVLVFDIWRISTHLRKGTDGYSWVNTFCNKKMILYSLFGWCVPLIFIILVAILDNHENVQDMFELYPGIKTMCWFNERRSAYAFLFGPMCFLLILNFVGFVLSVFNICKSTTQNAEFTNMKLNKQLLKICFVVFLAMGLFWIMEVVQFSTNVSPNDSIAWIVPDLINASQGIVIAAVYTCRPLAFRRLREVARNQTATKH